MLNPVDILYFKMAIGQDRIKSETPCDISARCPICGDSKYSKTKARLHLYEKNGKTFVNCFNECSCANKTVLTFLRDFYPNLYDGYKREVFKDQLNFIKRSYNDTIEKTDKSIKKSFENIFKTDTDVPCSDKKVYGVVPQILFNLTCFDGDYKKVESYYNSRGLKYIVDVFGKSFISHSNLTIDGKNYPLTNYIVIPFYCNDKMYGFYSRSLTEHKFFTYIPSKNVGFKLWNLYNVDISKPVYIFEGIFDALSAYQCGITNVVACCGATPPEDIIKSFNDAIFCLDNDKTGIENSIKYLKSNYKAVNWQNKFKDCNEMLKNNVDIKKEIEYNTVNGILGVVKLQSKL